MTVQQKETASAREAVPATKFTPASTVDNDLALAAVVVAIVIPLDDHGFIAARFTLANHFALPNPIPIVIGTAGPDRHTRTNRADAHANANFFRTRGQGAVNSDDRD